jgi:polyketide synthase PksN
VPRAPAPPAEQDIAIVGLAGRYPQAETLEAFWRNLAEGRDCIEEVPPGRWDHPRYAARSTQGTWSRWGGFLRDADAFDPLFFGIAPLEAERMDPQERLVLQTAWHTLEDAGYNRAALEQACGNRVGVFIGVMYSEYQLYPSLEQGLGMSGSYGTIANRVSYVLNLRGPSMAIDTMCSSSLTALHLACESIRRGDCAWALAGGVNLSLHPSKYATHAVLNMPSSDGRCHSFGAGGDGFVPGEGVGAVLLKPLAQALADGDHVYGVIKASAINHGGKTNGYTVPSPDAQQALVATALQRAGLHPRAISYVEAHGTGTALGDPIEIAGLSRAFGEHTAERQFCAIGSVKSNIGHCESAAGIAGLTKVLLQLQHGELAPSLHARVPNPNIDFSRTPFVLQQERAEWRRPVVQADGQARELPRIAGISSFGAGGSNAHVIVAEPPGADGAAPYRRPPGQPALVLLSARSEARLQEQARQLLAALEQGRVRDDNLDDVAYTLQVGREPLEHRLAFMVEGTAELGERLRELLAGAAEVEGVFRDQARRHRGDLALLVADEDMASTIEAWVRKGKFAKLLELWVRGFAFDWRQLYGEHQPRRVSLPGYPFARDRYWAAPPPASPSAAAPAGEGRRGFDRPFFEKLFQDLEGELLSVEGALAEVRKRT